MAINRRGWWPPNLNCCPPRDWLLFLFSIRSWACYNNLLWKLGRYFGFVNEADSDILEDVEASADDLVSEETIPPIMFIGPSLVSDTTIKFYERSGFFPKGMAQALGTETTPEPSPHKTVVFHDFFCCWASIPLWPDALRHPWSLQFKVAPTSSL